MPGPRDADRHGEQDGTPRAGYPQRPGIDQVGGGGADQTPYLPLIQDNRDKRAASALPRATAAGSMTTWTTYWRK